jgi:hypothetical protein
MMISYVEATPATVALRKREGDSGWRSEVVTLGRVKAAFRVLGSSWRTVRMPSARDSRTTLLTIRWLLPDP